MPGTFEDLEVWLARGFPYDERFGLVTQMRRAAVSIPSNIAEGKSRSTDKDFALFLSHSRGSQEELYTQVLIAKHPGYLSPEDANRLTEQIARMGPMLFGLIKRAPGKIV